MSHHDEKRIKWGLILPLGWHSEYPSSMLPEDKMEFMMQTAKTAERTGYDSIWTTDHLHPFPDPASANPVFECWTSLAAVARETKKIRIGQAVTCVCFRNPALLAKMAATVDLLSHGRLDMGMGACWDAAEFEAYGYDFSTGKHRLGQLRESLELMKRLWTEETVTYQGSYYQLKNAHSYPKPFQKPHPPIMIGGSGENITLRIVAEHAARSNFQDLPDSFARKLRILKQYCEAIHRDYDAMEKAYMRNFIVGKNAQDAESKMKKTFFAGDNMENYKQFNTWGSPETIIEHFRKYQNMGVDYFIVYLPNIVGDPEAVELFADEIFPAFA